MRSINQRQEIFPGSGVYLEIPMKPFTKEQESLIVAAVIELVTNTIVSRRCMAKKEKCRLRRARVRILSDVRQALELQIAP